MKSLSLHRAAAGGKSQHRSRSVSPARRHLPDLSVYAFLLIVSGNYHVLLSVL